MMERGQQTTPAMSRREAQPKRLQEANRRPLASATRWRKNSKRPVGRDVEQSETVAKRAGGERATTSQRNAMADKTP